MALGPLPIVPSKTEKVKNKDVSQSKSRKGLCVCVCVCVAWERNANGGGWGLPFCPSSRGKWPPDGRVGGGWIEGTDHGLFGPPPMALLSMWCTVT